MAPLFFFGANVAGGRIPSGVFVVFLGRQGRDAHHRERERKFARRLGEAFALLASRDGKKRRYARDSPDLRAQRTSPPSPSATPQRMHRFPSRYRWVSRGSLLTLFAREPSSATSTSKRFLGLREQGVKPEGENHERTLVCLIGAATGDLLWPQPLGGQAAGTFLSRSWAKPVPPSERHGQHAAWGHRTDGWFGPLEDADATDVVLTGRNDSLGEIDFWCAPSDSDTASGPFPLRW